MRFDNYLKEDSINENIIIDTLKKIAGKPANAVMKLFKDGFEKFVNIFQEQDEMTQQKVLAAINKAYGTNYKDTNDLKKAIRANLKESNELNEDWKHYWDLIKGEAFPALSFYPALTVWLEIDKLIRGNDANARVIVVYGLLWLLLISGKFIKGFRQWKKDNPEAYAEEYPKRAAKAAEKAKKKNQKGTSSRGASGQEKWKKPSIFGKGGIGFR